MKTLIFLTLVFVLFSTSNLLAQNLKIDYSEQSNILNPDTLNHPDQKAIFLHFVKETSEEIKTMPPEMIKEEFGKLGITTEEKQRFIHAYFFLVNTVESHKVSCENWVEFKYLKPNE